MGEDARGAKKEVRDKPGGRQVPFGAKWAPWAVGGVGVWAVWTWAVWAWSG